MAYTQRQNSTLQLLLLIGAFTLSGCSSFSLAVSQPSVDTDITGNTLQRHFYAGTGIGPSWMEPDTSEMPSFEVNDRVETGGQITLGMDLSKQLALEIHSADLGSAGLSPAGRVNYHMHGVSALVYAGKNRSNFKRQGFSGYGRVGLGLMENSSDANAPITQSNRSHFLTGAGIEYMTRFGLGLRAEGILFDQDARYAQLGLIYRTGRRTQSKPVEIVQAPAPIVAPIPAVAVVEKITPVVQAPIDTCSEITGVLNGVNFHSNSAKLTVDATYALDSVADRLLECETVAIHISAHTDSVGADAYNQNLSQQRASSVVDYLTSRGINSQRLNAEAFGETQPIDTNATADGRTRNRRVELKTVQ